MEFTEIIRHSIHYGGHFLLPGLLAYVLFKDNWRKAWLIMAMTIFVDLDHLLADPIFDPGRCSIGFHLLHTYWAIGGYIVLLFFKQTRILATGLLLHMLVDIQDCWWL